MKKTLFILILLCYLLTAATALAADTVVTLYGNNGLSSVTLTSAQPYYHNGVNGKLGTVDNVAAGANISAAWDAEGTAILTLNNVNLDDSAVCNMPLIRLSGSTTFVVPQGDTSSFINGASDSPVILLDGGVLRLTGSGKGETDGKLILKCPDNTDPDFTGDLQNAIVMTSSAYQTPATPYVIRVENLRLEEKGLFGFGHNSIAGGCPMSTLFDGCDVQIDVGYFAVLGNAIAFKNTTGNITAVGTDYDDGNDAFQLRGNSPSLTFEGCDMEVFGERDFAQFIMSGTNPSATIAITGSKLNVTGNSKRGGDGALEVWTQKNPAIAELSITDSEVTINSKSSRVISMSGLQSANATFTNSKVALNSSQCTTDGILLSSNSGANLTLDHTKLTIDMKKGSAGIRLNQGSNVGTLTMTGNKTELIGSLYSGHVLNGPTGTKPLNPTYQNYIPRVKAAPTADTDPLPYNEFNPASTDVYKNDSYHYLHILPGQPCVAYEYRGELIPTDVPVPAAEEAPYQTPYKAKRPGNSSSLSFVGWYTDEEGQSPYVNGTPLTKDTALYGYWRSTPPATGDRTPLPLLAGGLSFSVMAAALLLCKKKKQLTK